MILGHDLAWWGFALAVLGLVLMIPASMLANMLTPKLMNWWAQRSEASLRKRIKMLEDKLAEFEKHELISETDDFILRGIQALAGLCRLLLFIVPMCAYEVTVSVEDMQFNIGFWSSKEAWAHAPRAGIAALLLIYASVWWIGYSADKWLLRPMHRYRQPRSAFSRKTLKKDIEKLTAKIPSKAEILQ